MKQIIISLLTINCQLSIIICKAQNPFHFVKSFGIASPINEVSYNLLQNIDSTYFISGHTCTDCTNTGNIYDNFYKINKYGNIIINNLYPDSTRFTYYFDMKKNLAKNRVIFAGSHTIDLSSGTKAVGNIQVYDTLGLKLYENMIGDTNVSTILKQIKPIAENEILFCGNAKLDTTTNPSSAKAVIGKIDTLGNTIWLNYYPTTILSENPFYSIIRDTDGNYIAAGTYIEDNFLIYSKVWFKKFDTNGNQIWDTKPLLNSSAKCIINGNDGNPVFCGLKSLDAVPWQGTYGNAPLVGKINHNGQLLWQYKFKWGNNLNWVYANDAVKVVSAHGNGYVLFANVYTVPYPAPYCKSVPLMVKLNENGQEVWRKTYPASNDSVWDSLGNGYAVYLAPSYFLDGISTSDGGYAATGRIANLSLSNNVYMLKVNCNGDTASPKAQFNPVVSLTNDSIVTIHNQSQYFDTCVFMFSDGSPNEIITNTNASFTHTFPGNANNYGITCIAKACNQEWDTASYSQIITNIYNTKSPQGYLQNPIPNPTNGNTTINYFLPQGTKTASINITNQFGQIVKTINLNNGISGLANLSTDALSSGIYMLTLVTENGVIGSRRLVVQH